LYFWLRVSPNQFKTDRLPILKYLKEPMLPIGFRSRKHRPSGKLRSLHLYSETYQPSWSVVFHSGQAGVLEDEKILFLPIYFAGAFAQFGINSGSLNFYMGF
jgi:hypothetical protein